MHCNVDITTLNIEGQYMPVYMDLFLHAATLQIATPALNVEERLVFKLKLMIKVLTTQIFGRLYINLSQNAHFFKV